MGESVVLLDEADAGLLQLPGQPVVTIDVGLEGEREPGLQAEVEEAEVQIEEIKVHDPLRR